MAATQATELGSFLRSRRTALDPATLGLPVEGVRRTPGLRRTELASLAGVSPGYYTRLEQGRAPHPSPSVLAALANALRLSDDERDHLFALGGDARLLPAEPNELTAGARRMLELLSAPTAAYVINRYSDVLAWNDSAAALFGHLTDTPRRPNNVRYVFTDPESRQRFLEWDDIAADSVAHLRAATGHRPAPGRSGTAPAGDRNEVRQHGIPGAVGRSRIAAQGERAEAAAPPVGGLLRPRLRGAGRAERDRATAGRLQRRTRNCRVRRIGVPGRDHTTADSSPRGLTGLPVPAALLGGGSVRTDTATESGAGIALISTLPATPRTALLSTAQIGGRRDRDSCR